VGEGRVLALAFDAGPEAAGALARAAGRLPRDPRFRVTWETGPRLHVAFDALDGLKYLNGLQVRLELSQAAENTSSPQILDLPQTGPGRYELDAPAPRSPAFAALRVDGHVADRIEVAGRYAPEFDAIRNDHEAMRELARRSGGQVIPPRQVWPIDFRWPRRNVPLTSWLAAAGAIFIALGLARWKLLPIAA
ncbi:MAG TPA: hypothetical protein VFC78_05940, partial [Tepidisphaeraceae bacterium]|nr:hypothetical protein [Tepidisphaeraceae bacterium]